jgi:phosphoglycerol transferase MdoB-like AlkP superfamily enzyme
MQNTAIITRLKKTYPCNIYVALLWRLAIMLFLFFLSRFIFYAVNRDFFKGLTFSRWLNIIRGGFHFDLAALLYVNILFILLYIFPFPARYNRIYQKIAKIIFFVTNGLALLVNCIDFIYFRFTLRRSTLEVLKEFSHEKGRGHFFLTFINSYWYIVLIYISLLVIMVWLYNRVVIKKPERIRPFIYYPSGIILFAIVVALMVGGIRGDFKYSTRPITMSNAGEYVTVPGEIPLVLNTPFCLIRTFRQRFYEKENYFPDGQLEKIYTPVQHLSSDQPFRYDNVVIIILESFGKEGVGFYNKAMKNGTYKGYTPFLDSLLSVSFVHLKSFANGRKSIDALPSVLASIPNAETPFVLTPYASDKIKSLPAILKEKGYQTSFFHGAANGSMGFKAFVNLMGVEKYYGKDEYNNNADFDGLWGIWDEPFFQFFAHNLDTMQQPFFSTIFSVSSHEPYKVPEKYKGVFPKGDIPLHQCLGYSDMALRKFFATASTMKWFKHTLFVLTADHSNPTCYPEYQNDWGNMAIPILFYHPGDSSLRGVDSNFVQQIDIMPSVLSYLHYNGDVVSFGENIFDPFRNNFAVNYINSFQWFHNNELLQSDGHKTMGLYDFINDRFLKKNLQETHSPQQDSMEMKAKAFIQQYHNRLIGDRMLPGK